MLSYRCFEARCQPIDHWDKIQIPTDYTDEYAEALEEAVPCHECEADPMPRQCQHGCKERSERYLNEWIRGEANIAAFHCNIKMEWESMYEAGATGSSKMQFKKLRKASGHRVQVLPGKETNISQLVLHDFGLSIYARLHRKAYSHNAPWADDSHHEWHDGEDLLTIVCYLTTPKRFFEPHSYPVSEFEKEEIGDADLAVVQSSFVEAPNPADQPKRARQFRFAMSALGLEPYIHPSQLRRTISVEGDPEMLRQGGDGVEKGIEESEQDTDVSTASSDATEAQRSNESVLDAKMQSWPRLIQVVNASVML